MATQAPYEGSSTEEKAVLHHNNTGSPRAYLIHPTHFPVNGGQLAHQLNSAFTNGYKKAQADMRAALGLED